MDAFLQEISALPKVLGCFLYSSKQGVTGSNLPPIFKKNTINVIGTLLARSKKMGHTAKLDLLAIDIRYNETVLVARPLNKDSVLVTICESGVNRTLMDMSLNMVIKDIKESLTSKKKKAAPPTKSKPQYDIQLKPILDQIKDSLADAIGPIAGPVLDDCYKKWSSQETPSKKRLPDLAMIICKEIDDKNLEKAFMDKIVDYL